MRTLNLRLIVFTSLGLWAAQRGEAQHNQLTPHEAAAGYQMLFNGQTMEGWRGYNNLTPPNSWQVVPESTWKVIFIQSASPKGPLVTNDMSFRNFDLLIEWNIGSGGNSGIFIRYDKHGKNDWGGASGPEAQIAAVNNGDGTGATTRAGVCYDMFPLLPGAQNWDGTPNYGRWHQFRIVAYENHVAHFGNGKKLVEYIIGDTTWLDAYNNSKYSSFADYAKVHPGSIYLQHHGESGAKGPRFRNIRIKKLTENPWAKGSGFLANPEDTTSLRVLTYADLLFPGPTSTLPVLQPMRGPVSVFAAPGGYRLRFGGAGDYLVRAQDATGRTLSARAYAGTDVALLPFEMARGARILSVWSGDARIHSGLLPAR